ncbi:MAG: helix-turn-helix transcriptional regulator [Rhizobacter sp.]|nr:helix-turn-helix transcriptional regulator [Ferruginibacter sp.]
MTSPLKIFRVTYDMTQAELAVMLHVSHTTISKVESHQRALPEAAALTFARLQAYKKEELPVVADRQLSFEYIRDLHMEQSDQYLKSHKKDREALLHKYEKQVTQWVKKYNKAIGNLQLAERMIVTMTADQPDSPYLRGYEMDRLEALEMLMQISAQKPEIVMIKIAGLQQELRNTKAMLGKKRQYLGMEGDKQALKAPPPVLENGSATEGSALLEAGKEKTNGG